MREILFRGKNPDNGKWHEGVYSPYNWDFFGMKSEIPQIIILSEDKYLDGKWIEVIPETVGQYTGLKDKNGKRIFEHDVVRRFNSKGKEIMRYIVKWCDDCCIFVLSYWGDDMGYDTDFTVFYGAELEVIGNVFDNPELLKGE